MKQRRARQRAGEERERLSLRAVRLADTYAPDAAGRAVGDRIAALRLKLLGRQRGKSSVAGAAVYDNRAFNAN